MNPPAPHPPGPLAATIARHLREAGRLAADRRRVLDQLAGELADVRRAGGAIDLMFVCTHNSRRSQFGQVWAKAAADHFGLAGVRTWSGGTEATAFDRRAVAALGRAGFRLEAEHGGANPVYRVWTSAGGEPLRCWSKRFVDAPNPRTGFCALLMCAAADGACPTVPGAAQRVATTHDDPKAADGTPRETEAYDTCCAQIAREMLYLFREVGARG